MKKDLAILALSSYLEGEGPGSDGEWGMHCPMPSHNDARRSASLNINTMLWYCQVCEVGGPADLLVKTLKALSSKEKPDDDEGETKTSRVEISDDQVLGYHRALMKDRDLLREFMDRRALSADTITEYLIGYDYARSAYTIPIPDGSGEWVNIRFYQLDPQNIRRKIWSVTGAGEPVLYPINQLDSDGIIICEGELDALATIQRGFAAVTKTAGAKTWNQNWNKYFAGKTVWICNDRDDAGEEANRKISENLVRTASEVYIVELPYRMSEKHGKDITDFWKDGGESEEFVELLSDAVVVKDSENDPAPPVAIRGGDDAVDLSVIDSFDAENYGKPVRLRVTVVGKKYPTYLIPRTVNFRCDKNAGPKCMLCPMSSDWDGEHTASIAPNDPIILEMIDTPKDSLKKLLTQKYGIQTCNRIRITNSEMRSVEEIYVRPDVDGSRLSHEAGDYTTRRIVSVGRHDTQHNATVETIGVVWPNPRNQMNEYMAWKVNDMSTSIDTFTMSDEKMEALSVFKASGSPLRKCAEIAKDLSQHVTRIYGRPEMHVLIDLVYHSPLSYTLLGQPVARGWLEALIVGDTRTGKSEALAGLIRHYGAGDMVSCESTSFAGIVGGLEQYAGREWTIKWGIIPQNDRRLVGLDETSGLHTEAIAAMSSIRSSGEAQITKIHSERTYARTRLVWLGNPRFGRKLADFTYGAQAISPLIGNPEDVARFDLAMSVSSGDVPIDVINQYGELELPVYTSEICHQLVMWVWSRKPDQIKWTEDAERVLLDMATELGSRYFDDPPLVQAANVRIKIARVAAALAGRTFSTDDGENLIIEKRHVVDAVKFIDRLYGMPGFGYARVSEAHFKTQEVAIENIGRATAYLRSRDGLIQFLKSTGKFRGNDLQEMLNMNREESNATISQLWTWGMVRRQLGDIVINPVLHGILRSVE